MNASSASPRKRGDPHGWTSLDNYLTVHQRYLDNVRAYFVIADDLSYEFSREFVFEIRGRIRCLHGLFLNVEKTLEVNERRQVRTVDYSYHAGVEGPANRPIFRYDNAHTYAREGHPDDHHRHRYDPATWQEIEPPVWIGRERWPHLSEAIEELQAWWETTGQFLKLTEHS